MVCVCHAWLVWMINVSTQRACQKEVEFCVKLVDEVKRTSNEYKLDFLKILDRHRDKIPTHKRIICPNSQQQQHSFSRAQSMRGAA